jgi:hypothetical protein
LTGVLAVMIHEPAVLIEGVLFRARYIGSTQLVCEGQPTKTTRMTQAEEAVSRIKVRPAVGFLFFSCAVPLVLVEALFKSLGFIGITAIMSFDVLLTVTALFVALRSVCFIFASVAAAQR